MKAASTAFLAALCLNLSAAAPGATQTAELPDRVVAPPDNPHRLSEEPSTGDALEEQELPDRAAETPLPEPRPEALAPEAKPEARPTRPPASPGTQTVSTPASPPPEELACRKRLAELGVAFAVRPGEADASGCSMPWPVSVSNLGSGIAIEPDALLNCATAETAARFARDTLKGEVRAAFSTDLRAVRQVSGYVCRPRNGQTKLSEHAFGNALDIGGFVLKDGRNVAVARSTDLSVSRFLARIREAACGPFKTVLGPGTDADHSDHLHLDLAERRNGSTYCR